MTSQQDQNNSFQRNLKNEIQKWKPTFIYIYQVNSCKLVCVIDFLAVDSQRFLGISWTGTYHKSLVGVLIPSRFNPGLMASSKSDWMSNHAQMTPTDMIWQPMLSTSGSAISQMMRFGKHNTRKILKIINYGWDLSERPIAGPSAKNQ